MGRTRLTAWALTLAGLVPFVGLAGWILLNRDDGPRWLEPLTVYAAIIVSFLAGTRWGKGLAGSRWGKGLAERDPRPATLILSNLPPVAAWLTFLPGVPYEFRLVVLIFALVAMLYWDFRAAPPWYRTLRSVATAGAVLSLLAVVQAL